MAVKRMMRIRWTRHEEYKLKVEHRTIVAHLINVDLQRRH